MLDRALLALADERGSGQDHGEHGEIVDDLHHRGEPARLEVRVELCARDYFDRQAHQSFAPGDELGDVVDDHVLDVGHAIKRLGHGGGIYVDLNRGLPPLENIRLEFWGISMTKIKRSESIDASISDGAISTAGWKVGAVRPSAIRRDRSE